MSTTTLVLENNKNKEERHAVLLNELRNYLQNPDLELEYSPKGKPSLVGSRKYISVTTTGTVMVCVISDTPVGIDGEYMPRFSEESKTDYTAIAERFFTEEEAEYVRDGDADGVRFAKIWIRKEALSKFTGKGLSDFSNFSVNDGERFYGRINGIPIKRLNVSFPGSTEYLFAIAGDYND